jgi:prophage regulatory protein
MPHSAEGDREQRSLDRILRLPEVKKVTGLSRSQIYLKMNDDDFPKAVPLCARAVGWLESEIIDWFQVRKNARDRRGVK